MGTAEGCSMPAHCTYPCSFVNISDMISYDFQSLLLNSQERAKSMNAWLVELEGILESPFLESVCG